MKLEVVLSRAINGYYEEPKSESPKVASPSNSNFACSKCGITFLDLKGMKNHFNHHRHPPNIPNEALGTPSFAIKKNGKLYFTLDDLECSIWACFLYDQKISLLTRSLLVQNLNYLIGKNIMIILLRSGRFAGGIFDIKGNAIATKTYRKYTVRSGRGFSQSKAGGSKKFNSAGAQIRMENEKTLKEDIYELFSKWQGNISSCSCILWNFTPNGEALLFGEKSPINHMKKSYKYIPFEVFEPTLEELNRVSRKILDPEQGSENEGHYSVS